MWCLFACFFVFLFFVVVKKKEKSVDGVAIIGAGIVEARRLSDS